MQVPGTFRNISKLSQCHLSRRLQSLRHLKPIPSVEVTFVKILHKNCTQKFRPNFFSAEIKKFAKKISSKEFSPKNFRPPNFFCQKIYVGWKYNLHLILEAEICIQAQLTKKDKPAGFLDGSIWLIFALVCLVWFPSPSHGRKFKEPRKLKFRIPVQLIKTR